MTREEKKAALKEEYAENIKNIITPLAVIKMLFDIDDPELGEIFIELIADELEVLKNRRSK